ncbi:hypothetical protein ACU82A_29850 [Bacillus cereus]
MSFVFKESRMRTKAISDLMNVRLWKALTGLGYSVEEIYLLDAFVKHKGVGVNETT